MGGIEYFTTTAETPEGDSRLLEIVMQEMNADIDPLAEETKGGSKHVAKCILSASDAQLAVVTYVPSEKTEKLRAGEWLDALFAAFGAGEVVSSGNCKAVGVCKADGDAGRFPIKLRDQGISASIAFLTEKGLVDMRDDDDSDEMVFGDDDFPCDNED
jgi:hypothetical protein